MDKPSSSRRTTARAAIAVATLVVLGAGTYLVLDAFAVAVLLAVALYAVGRGAALQLKAARFAGWLQLLLGLGLFGQVAEHVLHGSTTVALAMMARSPKSWETSFTYGVSPQPVQAPENSNSGWSSCEFLMVFGFIAVRSISGSL